MTEYLDPVKFTKRRAKWFMTEYMKSVKFTNKKERMAIFVRIHGIRKFYL